MGWGGSLPKNSCAGFHDHRASPLAHENCLREARGVVCTDSRIGGQDAVIEPLRTPRTLQCAVDLLFIYNRFRAILVSFLNRKS